MVRTDMVAKLGFAALGFTLAFAPLGRVVAGEVEGSDGAAVITQPPATAGDAAGNIEKGRELFSTWSCGGCHVLADAGATGPVGPSLDHDPNLTHDLIVSRLTDGQAGMPAFAGQMSEDDIADVTAYIAHAAAK